MSEFIFTIFLFLILFILCCLLAICNFIYLDWEKCSHGLAIFYVAMAIVTSVSYYYFIIEMVQLVKGLLGVVDD